MVTNKDICRDLDVSKITEVYSGEVKISDLKEELGTAGHVLVVRGDRAYQDKVGYRGNPKFWLYENLLNSDRIQKSLQDKPNSYLFDGVGLSGLEALGWHSQRVGREVVLIMAKEHEGSEQFPKDILDRYRLGIIVGDGPAEEGYVKKQAEILSRRKDIIPLHQALYGPRCMAPIGNNLVGQLEQMAIRPDETFWVCAGGSNLYGIGRKIQERFGSKVNLVEPADKRTICPDLDLKDSEAVKEYARNRLSNYSLDGWDGIFNPEEFPLHVKHPNRYLLVDWRETGYMGIDKTIGITPKQREEVSGYLKGINPDYSWTGTTYLALAPAIQKAREGKNVLVMAYGRDLTKL